MNINAAIIDQRSNQIVEEMKTLPELRAPRTLRSRASKSVADRMPSEIIMGRDCRGRR